MEYTDPPNLLEDERMTAIEFKAIREWLAVSGDWLARHLDVDPRTVRNWEQGRYPIPDGVRLEVEALEAVTAQTVTANIEALQIARDPAVVTYRSDEEFWNAVPDEPRWPASWHRRVAVRIAQKVPGLVIVEPSDRFRRDHQQSTEKDGPSIR